MIHLGIENKQEADAWLVYDYSHINRKCMYMVRGSEGVEKASLSYEVALEYANEHFPHNFYDESKDLTTD